MRSEHAASFGFELQILLAVADGAVRQLRRGDGGGSRQGAGRHAAPGEDRDDGEPRSSSAGHRADSRAVCCAKATSCWCRAGEVIPGDGEIIEGVASVDESADHRRVGAGHSRGGRRSVGGDRRHARAVGLDQGARDGQPRRDVSRSHDRAGRRRGAAEDAERDRPQHPAGRPDDRVPDRGRDAAAARDLFGRAAVAVRAGRRCSSA